MTTPTTEQEPAAPADSIDLDLQDVFGFDPFEPETDAGDTGNAAASPAEPAAPSVGTEGGDAGAVPLAAPAEPAPVVPPTPQELELESLRAQLAAKEKKEADDAAAAEAAKAAQPDPAPAQPAAPKPIDFKLPQTHVDAMLSEDPEQNIAAMNSIVSGIMSWAQAEMAGLRAEIAQLTAGAKPASAGNTSAAAAPAVDTSALDTMRTQYYTSFPDHQKPEYQAILQAVSAEMAKNYPGHAWNTQYIAALGTNVNERVKALAKLSMPAAAPPVSLQPGARSAAPGSGDQDISDEILDSLGFG